MESSCPTHVSLSYMYQEREEGFKKLYINRPRESQKRRHYIGPTCHSAKCKRHMDGHRPETNSNCAKQYIVMIDINDTLTIRDLRQTVAARTKHSHAVSVIISSIRLLDDSASILKRVLRVRMWSHRACGYTTNRRTWASRNGRVQHRSTPHDRAQVIHWIHIPLFGKCFRMGGSQVPVIFTFFYGDRLWKWN